MDRLDRPHAIVDRQLDLYGGLLDCNSKAMKADVMRSICKACPYNKRKTKDCLAAGCFHLENWLMRCFIESEQQ